MSSFATNSTCMDTPSGLKADSSLILMRQTLKPAGASQQSQQRTLGRNVFQSWKFQHHFIFKEERGWRNFTVQCKLCLPAKKMLSVSKDSTSNLTKHLKRMHPRVIHSLPKANTSDHGDDGKDTAPPPLKQAILSTPAITQRRVNSLIFDFIVNEVLPFSTVENASFRKMVEGLSGAFNEYGDSETEDDLEDTDDVQFDDVTTVLEEEQEHKELNLFLPPHHRCAAHTLNLIATTDLDKAASQQGVSRKLYRSAKAKSAAIWNKAHRSSGASDVIEEIVQMRCVVPSVTRWSSEYHAIEKLMNLAESQLNEICEQLKVAKLHPQETVFLKEYAAILKPLAYSVNLFQGEKNCYFGYVIPTLLSLKAKLSEKLTQVQFSTHILLAIIKAIDTRFAAVLASHEARMAASTIPKFRLWWLADDERESMRRTMVQEARLLNTEPSNDTSTTGYASVGNEPEDDDDSFFSFQSTQVTCSTAQDEPTDKCPAQRGIPPPGLSCLNTEIDGKLRYRGVALSERRQPSCGFVRTQMVVKNGLKTLDKLNICSGKDSRDVGEKLRLISVVIPELRLHEQLTGKRVMDLG
nr:PREDICTED: uncharacterized protein LOC106456273 [Pundamilia nyererei]